jgi:hypothetical protein
MGLGSFNTALNNTLEKVWKDILTKGVQHIENTSGNTSGSAYTGTTVETANNNTNGAFFTWTCPVTSAGATSITINGNSTRNLRYYDAGSGSSNTKAGSLLAGRTYLLQVRGSSNYWIVSESLSLSEFMENLTYRLVDEGGTASAYTANTTTSTNTAGFVLTNYSTFTWVPTLDCLANATLSINGTTALPLNRGNNTTVQAGDLKAGRTYVLQKRTNNYTVMNSGLNQGDLDIITAAANTASTAAAAASAKVDTLLVPGTSMGGFSLLEDAAGNTLLRKDPDGLNFIPSQPMSDRVGVKIGTSDKTLSGFPMFTDGNGNMLMVKDPTGLDFVPSDTLLGRLGAVSSAAPAGAAYSRTVGSLFVYAIRNAKNQLEEFVSNGNYTFFRNDTSEGETPTPVLDMITVQGQSLSVGATWTNTATPDTIDIGNEDAYILVGLKRADSQNVVIDVRGALSQPLLKTADATDIGPLDFSGNGANTISSVAAPMAGSLNRHRKTAGAPRSSVLTISHGYSGVAWDLIDSDPATGPSSDTTIWDNTVYWTQQAKRMAGIQSASLACPAHVMVHGTSAKSVSSPIYYNFLTNYMTDYRNMLLSEGIPGAAHLYLTQSSGDANTANDTNWDVTQDQLRFCQENKATLATPLYPYPIWDNNVHPDGETTLRFSEAIAKAIAEEAAGRKWTTLGPLGWTVHGNSVTIQLDRRLDENLVAHASSKYAGAGISNIGFEATGATISSVDVFTDRVRLNCSAVPTTISYAMQVQDMTGVSGNQYTAHRGLLRSSYSWKSLYDGNLIYRWVPSFKITL